MTKQEFDDAYDGQHIDLVCEDHPHLVWSCKRIAISGPGPDGKYRYNGSRHLFFKSVYPLLECSCPSSKLYAVVEP